MKDYDAVPARLRIRQGPLPGKTFPVAGEKTYIGRDLGNDIVIDDPEVSRRHACIVRQAGGYSIEDMGSTNGTFVNGVRITGLTGKSQPLRDGDIIGLGQVILAFEETVEAGGDTIVSGVAPPPPAYAPPHPAYAAPPPTTPSSSALGGGNARWFLLGCGCVFVAFLSLVILIAVLIATGVIDLGNLLLPAP